MDNNLLGKHVAIVALGASAEDYSRITKVRGGRKAYCDETWAINAMGGVIQCDRIFHMDDVRVQELRAEAQPRSNIAVMLDWLGTTDVPVYTSHVDAEALKKYPSLKHYPLEPVIQSLGEWYFNNTVPYAVAYAIVNQVEKISLFGCDYSYKDVHKAERGRACLEFWLGMAKARGIKVAIPPTTSLFDTVDHEGLYGYKDGYDLTIHHPNLDIEFKPKELPTAEEVEAAYNHHQHTSKLVKNGEIQHD